MSQHFFLKICTSYKTRCTFIEPVRIERYANLANFTLTFDFVLHVKILLILNVYFNLFVFAFLYYINLFVSVGIYLLIPCFILKCFFFYFYAYIDNSVIFFLCMPLMVAFSKCVTIKINYNHLLNCSKIPICGCIDPKGVICQSTLIDN